MAKKLVDSINMEVKEVGACTKEFAFVVPADAAKNESVKVTNYIAGVAQIPGFRPGKAPMGIVSKKYAAEINDELRNRFVSSAVEKVESDKDLDILSLRFKDMGEFKAGEEFTFSFEAVIAPAVEVGDYKAIKVEVPLDAVDDKAIAERLDIYRNMYGSYADVNEAAIAEDMLKVDYTSDFAVAEDASASLKRQVEAKDAFIWLNEPENIPGCIKALTGAEAGKEYTFEAAYPADYREAALAGKSVNYTVKVAAVQRRKQLTDDELVERTRSESIDALKANIRKGLETDAESKRRQEATEAYFKKLDETVAAFELPAALVDAEIQKALQKLASTTVKNEEDAEKFKAELETHRAAAKPEAETAVRRALILRKLAKLENIEVSDAELDGQMQMMSHYYGYKPQELRATLEKSGAIEELRADIVNAKVLEKLSAAALA